MLLTPMIVNLGDKLAFKLENKPMKIESNYVPEDSWRGVVIAGYGRVGRLVTTMLEHAGVAYVAFDMNVKRVELGQKEGRPVYYGEVSQLEFLNKIGLERVEAIIVTVDDYQKATKIISHVRSQYPSLMILARSRDMTTRNTLLSNGATWVMPESSEGSLRLGEEALLKLGMPKEEVFDILTFFRKNDYEAIREIHQHNSNED
jgi:voltage-gated potassium channel Kch